MNRLAVLLAITMAACTTTSDDVIGLDADTYYELDPAAGPCNAPGPDDCAFELGLCLSGVYYLKVGDVISMGDYILEGDTAVDDSTSFEFDLASQTLDMNHNFDGEVWTVLPVAPTDVDCTR